MNVPTITTNVKFEAAHRQLGDTSKCGFLHGHNWSVDVIMCGKKINEIGYVVDFKDVKEFFMKYDHTVMLKEDDPLVEVLMNAGQKVCCLPVNPTCEELCLLFAEEMVEEFNLEWIKLTVWENHKSKADVTVYADEV